MEAFSIKKQCLDKFVFQMCLPKSLSGKGSIVLSIKFGSSSVLLLQCLTLVFDNVRDK